MKRKSVLMTVLAVALTMAGNLVPAAAQAAKADLIIGNGTGGEITAMIISPAKGKYPKNENRLAFKGLAVKDTDVFSVVLPEQFKELDTFDIELMSNGKRFVTKKEVKIDLKRSKPPVLELSKNGKDSTRALIGATAGGVGGVAAVAATATVLYTGFGMAVGDLALLHALGVAGSIFGGGILLGSCVVAAIPVALGVWGYLVGRAITPSGLDVQAYYN